MNSESSELLRSCFFFRTSENTESFRGSWPLLALRPLEALAASIQVVEAGLISALRDTVVGCAKYLSLYIFVFTSGCSEHFEHVLCAFFAWEDLTPHLQ